MDSKYQRVIVKDRDTSEISNGKSFKGPPKKSYTFTDYFLNAHVSGG